MPSTSITRLADRYRKRIQSWSRLNQLDPYASIAGQPACQHALAAEVLHRGSHESETIWLDYLANGGNADLAEFHGYLNGNLVMPDFERRALEHTLWEHNHFTAEGAYRDSATSAVPIRPFAAVPNANLLASLMNLGQPLARTALREATVLVTRMGREQLDRISARPPWRHRRYVGW